MNSIRDYDYGRINSTKSFVRRKVTGLRVTRQEIEEIKKQSSIEEIANEYGLQVKRTGGSKAVCLCPFHDDTNPSCSLDIKDNYFNCFACGAKGDVIRFVMEYEGLSFIEAIEKLAKRIDFEIKEKQSVVTIPPRMQRLYDLNRDAMEYMQMSLLTNGGQVANAYLEGRGIEEDLLDEFLVGYCPSGDLLYQAMLKKGYLEEEMIACDLLVQSEHGLSVPFANRLVFAILDEKKRIVGFVTRRIEEDGSSKYINSKNGEIYNKKAFFFASRKALSVARSKERLYIVEGPFDVLAFARCGIYNCVSLLGLNLSKTQMDLIGRYTKEVVLCLDMDEAGKLATVKLGRMLVEEGFDVVSVYAKSALFKDFDELVTAKGVTSMQEALKQEIDWLEVCMMYYEELYDFTTRCGKKKYRNKILQEIACLQEDNDRAYWSNYLLYQMQFAKEDYRSELHEVGNE